MENQFNFNRFERDFSQKDDSRKQKALNYLLDCYKKHDSEATTFLLSSKFSELIRKEKLFLKEKFLTIIQQFKIINFQEYQFLKRLNDYVLNQIKQFDNFLKKISWEDLIIHLGFLYDFEKIYKKTPLDGDTDLISVINRIINTKLSLSPIDANSKHKVSNHLQFYFKTKQIVAELIQGRWGEVYQIYQVYEKYDFVCYLIDQYAYQNYQITIIDDKAIHLKPESESWFQNWQYNGAKYPYIVEFYRQFTNEFLTEQVEEIMNSNQSWYNKEGAYLALNHTNQYLDYLYGFELKEKHKGRLFSADNFFKVLGFLSTYANLRWNYELPSFMNRIQRPFESMQEAMCHIRNDKNEVVDISPVLFREYQSQIQGIKGICGIDEKEIEAILETVTTNLNRQETKSINLHEQPLIKIGSNSYSICGITANKNYATILHNLIFNGKIEVNDQNLSKNNQSANFEKEIEGWFQLNHFKTKQGFIELDSTNQPSGDIDDIAYADGKLFIIQFKSTYARSTIKQIYDHKKDENTGFAKAYKQLEKDIEFLHSNSNARNLLSDLGIEDISKVEIIPLIVTTTFEEEGKTYPLEVLGKKYEVFKVSVFELRVILHNWKLLLFEPNITVLKMKFGNNIPPRFQKMFFQKGFEPDRGVQEEYAKIFQEFYPQLIEHLQFNLWKDNQKDEQGKRYCTANDLYNAIKNESVWDFLPKGNFPMQMKTVKFGELVVNYY